MVGWHLHSMDMSLSKLPELVMNRRAAVYGVTKSWTRLSDWTELTVLSGWVLSCFSHVQLFVTLRIIAHQAPLSRGFSWQEYWSGLPCSPPGDLPNPGLKPASLCLLHWQEDSLPLAPPRKPRPECPPDINCMTLADVSKLQRITSILTSGRD